MSVFFACISAPLLFALSMLKNPHPWISAEIKRFKTVCGEGCHSGLRLLLERISEWGQEQGCLERAGWHAESMEHAGGSDKWIRWGYGQFQTICQGGCVCAFLHAVKRRMPSPILLAEVMCALCSPIVSHVWNSSLCWPAAPQVRLSRAFVLPFFSRYVPTLPVRGQAVLWGLLTGFSGLRSQGGTVPSLLVGDELSGPSFRTHSSLSFPQWFFSLLSGSASQRAEVSVCRQRWGVQTDQGSDGLCHCNTAFPGTDWQLLGRWKLHCRSLLGYFLLWGLIKRGGISPKGLNNQRD